MSADTAEKTGPLAVTASIVPGNRASGAYPMFEARDISPDGALLVGGLFLEVNEEFTVELGLGGGAVRATARVVKLEHNAPGMRVAFTGVSNATREALQKYAGG